MTYLLDVNALIALGLQQHQHHPRMTSWVQSVHDPVVATCPLTELGFIRVIPQLPGYGFSLENAKALLLAWKRSGAIRQTFLTDSLEIDRLPDWVQSHRQTTDGYLAALAEANGAILATMDTRIPGAMQIP